MNRSNEVSRGPNLTFPLLMLTFVTGIVDAVTFLGLGMVFAAMQTGNVIFLGLGIAGAEAAPFLAPLLSLLAFVAGSALAAMLFRRHSDSPRFLAVRTAATIEAAILALAVVLAALADPAPKQGSAYAIICVLALAMGMRNSLVRGIAGPNMATTVLNLTVTGLSPGGQSPFASGSDLGQRGAAMAAILLGAVAGALLLELSVALAIGLAALASLLAALALTTRSGPAAAAEESA